MTPKEKAEELIDKFLKPIIHLHQYPICLESAIECALIAVDELIDQSWNYREIDLGLALEYWEEVQQEIEKL
jgi:hypothetical protein